MIKIMEIIIVYFLAFLYGGHLENGHFDHVRHGYGSGNIF